MEDSFWTLRLRWLCRYYCLSKRQ